MIDVSDFEAADSQIHGREHVIFTDEINQTRLAAILEDRRVHIGKVHVDAIHAHCLQQGLEITWPPTDMPWGIREMHVRHPDWHVFRISQGIGEEEEA